MQNSEANAAALARAANVAPSSGINVIETTNQPSMEELLSDPKNLVVPKEGDTMEGTIIGKGKTELHVDLGGILTGVVRGRELLDELDTFEKIQTGDKIQVSVLEVENENGEVELSIRRAGREKAWNDLSDLKDKKADVDIHILEANKGGLIAEMSGIQGFLPVSQLSAEHYPRVEDGDKQLILDKLTAFVGQTLKVKILDLDKKEEKLIFSEKQAEAEEKREIIDKLTVGQRIKGKVSGIVDFGAFVQFDGLEGLVHISEMAWQRIDNPADIVKVGEEVEAEIISIENGRISLSMKRLKDDPWVAAVEKYSVGDVVKGKVTKVTVFGAFVQLDENIHGLVHVSELSSKSFEDPSDVIKAGDEKEFKILSIEPKEHRLGLSLKALEDGAKEEKTETKEDAKGDESEEK
jgi:small subunit ribosomal protein S1